MIGVSYNKRQRKWRACANRVYIGSFDTEEEAIKARTDYTGTGKRIFTRLPDRPNFSLTASNSVFTMALFPTKRRTRSETQEDRTRR